MKISEIRKKLKREMKLRIAKRKKKKIKNGFIK